MSQPDDPEVMIYVCGGIQAKVCPKTGKSHNFSDHVHTKEGGTVVCHDCGVTAMEIDLMDLP